MNRKSNRLTKSNSDMVEFWQSTNTAGENAIIVFPVLPGIVQKHKLFEVAK